MPTDADYTIADLARLTGVNVRTIRYWIAQGLIPASGESGPGAHYGQGHLDRLRLVKRLQAEYLPNAEIRRRLAPLSDAEVASLVEEPAAADPSRPTTSALEYVRGLLGQPPGPDTASRAVPPAAAPPRAAPPPPPALRPHAAALKVPSFALVPTPGLRRPAMQMPEAPTEPAPDASVGEPAPVEPGSPVADGDGASWDRSQWERVQVTENIELHIRRPLSRPEQRRVERLITIARQVFDEDRA